MSCIPLLVISAHLLFTDIDSLYSVQKLSLSKTSLEDRPLHKQHPACRSWLQRNESRLYLGMWSRSSLLSKWTAVLNHLVNMVAILPAVLVLLAMLGVVLSLDQDIVLRFGDNSLRIEKDNQEQGGQTFGVDGSRRWIQIKTEIIGKSIFNIQTKRPALCFISVY